MMAAFAAIDLTILLAGAIMMAWTSKLLAGDKACWPVVGPLWIWAIHLVCLYTVVVIGDIIGAPILSTESLAIWSTTQRLHGVITMFFVTYLFSLRRAKR